MAFGHWCGSQRALSVLLLPAVKKNENGVVGIKCMWTIKLAVNTLIFRTNFKMEAKVGRLWW
jgi:hypothetical protein